MFASNVICYWEQHQYYHFKSLILVTVPSSGLFFVGTLFSHLLGGLRKGYGTK